MHHPTDRITTYHGLCYTPVVEHWLEREIAQRVVHHEVSIRRSIAQKGSIRRPTAPWANAPQTVEVKREILTSVFRGSASGRPLCGRIPSVRSRELHRFQTPPTPCWLSPARHKWRKLYNVFSFVDTYPDLWGFIIR